MCYLLTHSLTDSLTMCSSTGYVFSNDLIASLGNSLEDTLDVTVPAGAFYATSSVYDKSAIGINSVLAQY